MAISAQLWLLVLLRQPARPLHSREREIGEQMRRVTYKISFSYYALKAKLRVNIREIREPAENAYSQISKHLEGLYNLMKQDTSCSHLLR